MGVDFGAWESRETEQQWSQPHAENEWNALIVHGKAFNLGLLFGTVIKTQASCIE